MLEGSAPVAPPPARRGMGYFVPIDGLRAIAVLSVMAFHLHAGLLPGGYVGVDIFFVISGFVVTSSLGHARFARFGDLLRFFYARRLFRIMPALIVMLAVTLILSAMLIPDAWLSDAIYAVGRDAFVGLSNVRLAMQTDSYFAPREAFNPFLHTWSLGVEEQFYLLFPFIMWLKLRRGDTPDARRAEIVVIAALSILSLIACALLSAVAWRYAFYSVPARFWELGTGMILSLTFDRWRPAVAAAGQRTIAAMTATGCACLLAAFAVGEGTLFPFPLALLPVGGTALLIMLVSARPEGRSARLLAMSGPVGVGKLSYSLYLWHWPVFVLMRWTCGLAGLAQSIAAVALVFALSWLSYRFVEQPMRRVSAARSRLSPGRLVAAALCVTLLATASAHILIKQRQRLSLSVTRDRAIWQPDEVARLFPADARCALTRSEQPLAGGSVTSWTPSGCPAADAPRLYLVGDSHSVAMRPLALQYAAERGMSVRSVYLSGCHFLSLYEPLAARPQCRAFIDAAVDLLAREARSGDIVFLPSLRIPRLQEQAGQSALPETPSASAHDRRIALAEGEAIAARLSANGAQIVIEAPLPVFRAPPFRCSDWFNRMNPDCAGGLTVPARLIAAMRAPVLDAAAALALHVRGVSIWDPFPVLCPGATCGAFRDGKPLFFDGDHLSGYGNRLLYPSFKAHLRRVEAPPPG